MEQEQTIAKDVPNTREMVRKLEETTGVAGGMLESLHTQGEQMDRIIDMNDSHSDQLYTAERLTTQLSFTGRISNIFRKKYAHHKSKPQISKEHPEKKVERKVEKKESTDKKDKKKQQEEEELSPEDRLWKERSDPNYVPPTKTAAPANAAAPANTGVYPPDLTTAQMQLIEEQDKDLDQMANLLYTLREMSQVTQVELQNQSKKIDVMDEQIEKNLHSTKKTTAKLAKYG